MPDSPKMWRKQLSQILLSTALDRSAQEENLRCLLALGAARRFWRIGPTYQLCFAKGIHQHPQFPNAQEITLTLEVRETEDA
jgi:hypothetical protein